MVGDYISREDVINDIGAIRQRLTRNAYGGEVIRHLEAAYKRTEPPKEES